MPFLDRSGVKIYYEDHGHGSAILLSHGYSEWREHETNRVIDEERGKYAGDNRYSREQPQRGMRPAHDPAAHLSEKAGEAEIGDHDHYPEQQGEPY